MQDYYKILEVGYDATDDAIRSNYIRLALKWHPDKQKDQDSSTSRFQEINEAYQVLGILPDVEFCLSNSVVFIRNFNDRELEQVSDLVVLLDSVNICEAVDDRRLHSFGATYLRSSEFPGYGLVIIRMSFGWIEGFMALEYLNRYKGLILTCNGLGIRHSIW
ncbi:DnaJ domain containing protein [Parasponia andersonii]|uniref:DnaJ domain containing protein n=1 Tax=Parasponia andersonii TaxID=3476 RepID=A0A2P5CR40_PARAD|nr:DnaJ domain containing protein [Parasponia andersonii]